AAQSEADLRAHAVVSAGARHHGIAPGGDALRPQRAARSRSSCLPSERHYPRPSRPPDLPEALEHGRDGQGREGRTPADLGAREDVTAACGRPQLAVDSSKRGGYSFSNSTLPGSALLLLRPGKEVLVRMARTVLLGVMVVIFGAIASIAAPD